MTKSVLVIFLDGVGLGEANPKSNPFMHVELPTLQSLLGISHLTQEVAGTITSEAALWAVDACLDIPGLPQSATGQTTILTGRNAAAVIGKHYGPYPDEALLEMLVQESFFKTVQEAGYSVAYANAYPTHFLDRLERGTGRLSANAKAAYLSGLRLRNGEDLQQGRAISSFLSNEFWPEVDLPLPPITPYQAGQQLADLALHHRLTFFEFWYSDLLGHKQARADSLKMLMRLDQFFGGVLSRLDLSRLLLLIISDHGNFEDWTTSKHTRNPVLGLLCGPELEKWINRLHSLVDVKKLVTEFLGI